MLCSNCSRNVKPIVALDIDGTMADYHGHFLYFAGRYFDNLSPVGYDGSYEFKEWYLAETGLTYKDWHDVKLAYRQGGMKRTMPVLPGARTLCSTVKVVEAELWVTTTRPYLGLDNIVPDTVEWLRRARIDYDFMLFDDDKYDQLAQRVDPDRVIAVFDDLIENVRAVNTIFPGRGWLVQGEYNQSVRAPLMCDLDAAPEIVYGAAHTWRESR